jgi:hypothetical protein
MICVAIMQVHDKTVPYVTGSASLVDPFEKYETNGIDM